MRASGLSNSEIAYELAKQGIHETSRESVCVIVSYLRRRGVRIPRYRGKRREP